MDSKAILFLCLLPVVLVIASEVTAREMHNIQYRTNAAEKRINGLEESKYPGGGYGGYPGGGYRGYPGGGSGGGRGGYGGGCGGYGGGGYCRYSCCGRGYYAGESVDAEPETEPQN
ncbi:glycine-rich protein 3 short isoform-like [Coffea eugenioides]|uniref:Glycine-rich protein-like n=1 Tax=Coffea arabica TaxID=13443 RepID=A0A6P6WYH1_COFAR|nr:glycine-rich protein 3 short isoform-like [Coffea arabica]XP_027166098.1 glycine-rich protein 3 short isoform-like [Coffea eugenioides]